MSFQGTFVQDGRNIDYTPVSAVVAGQVVLRGNLCGIAPRAIAAGELGALATAGVFDVVQAAVTFADGGPVYWDADGNPVGGTPGTGAATTVPTGNTFMGFALGITAATDATVRMALRAVESSAAETLALADLSDITGPMSYTAGKILVADGNSYEPVAVSGDATLSSAGVVTLANAAKPLSFVIADPGTGQAIPVTASGHVDIVSGGAGETNTLAVPTFAGQVLALSLKTDGGGDRVITVADPHIDGTNNTITLNDAGDTVLLLGVAIGASFGWRLVVNVGATLSHV